MTFETLLGAWVAAGLTLFIFTFLYKDNPLFKLAEHLYIGVSVGYTIVKTYDTVVVRLIYEPMIKQGDWSLLVPLAIGTLMLARYVPKATWLSRIAFAFIVGVGSGLAIPRIVSSYILKQIEDTMRPIFLMPFNDAVAALTSASIMSILLAAALLGVIVVALYTFLRSDQLRSNKIAQAVVIISFIGLVVLVRRAMRGMPIPFVRDYWSALVQSWQSVTNVVDVNALLVLFGVLCVLFYFFFSIEHTGLVRVAARIGILFLMISFGAAFGYTVMARMSLLIGRLSDLIEYSSPQYGWASLILLVATILTLVLTSGRREEQEPK
jgi:hypothetical protein